MITAGKAAAQDFDVVTRLVQLVQPAIDEADRQKPGASGVSVRIWATPLIVDVLHQRGDLRGLALRVFVTDERVGIALEEFLTAGLNRLPPRDRLRVIAKSEKTRGVSLAAEIDLFGGAVGVIMTVDEQHRVELFQLAEPAH